MRGVGTVTPWPRDRGPAAQPGKVRSPDPGDWRTRRANGGSVLGMVTGAFLRRKDRAKGETDTGQDEDPSWENADFETPKELQGQNDNSCHFITIS